MRLRAGEIANAVAWAMVLVLAAVAILVAWLLGFGGILILGLLTWVICTHLELEDRTPASSVTLFRSQMQSEQSPEARAAARDDRHRRLSPLRFYRWCGIGLTAAGALGFVWQRWAQP